jgi:putative acetyltransferase
VSDRAFGQQQEGTLVETLRSRHAVLLSLVAVARGCVVGHILYSPASIGNVSGAALGPMSVLPEFQRQGIGSELIEAGTIRLQSQGCPFVIVVGHEHFYPRFGFVPASRHGVTCQWDVPDNVFMIRILDERRMQGVSGLATYRDEFSMVT